jgi:hypothetical protein
MKTRIKMIAVIGALFYMGFNKLNAQSNSTRAKGLTDSAPDPEERLSAPPMD